MSCFGSAGWIGISTKTARKKWGGVEIGEVGFGYVFLENPVTSGQEGKGPGCAVCGVPVSAADLVLRWKGEISRFVPTPGVAKLSLLPTDVG